MFERFVRLIRCCNEVSQLKQVDLYICECGLGSDRYLGNLLIHQYGRAAGRSKEAEVVFHRITNRNLFSWGSLLTCYTSIKSLDQAWATFNRMPHHSQLCFSCMVSAHTHLGHLELVLDLFHLMPQRDVVAWTALLQAYSHDGHLSWVTIVFHKMPMHDLVSANLGIALYAQLGDLNAAIRVFVSMPILSVVSCSTLVSAFATSQNVHAAKQIFDAIPPELGLRNEITWNALLSSCDEVMASKLFHLMPQWSLASWNTVLGAYPLDRAMQAFHNQMPERNHISWNAIITANAGAAVLSSTPEAALCKAESTHDLLLRMPARDMVSWTSTMTALVVTGCIERVLTLFLEMPSRNEVAWTLLVEAFAHQQQMPKWRQAQLAFDKMPQHNSILSTCMITLLARTGRPEQARSTFSAMKHHDLISWSALIASFAHNGLEIDAIFHFHLMLLHGFQPDEVCFGALLLACSHLGMLQASVEYYCSMKIDHGVGATGEHLCCMVDVFGRAGLVKQAEQLLHDMPEEDSNSVASVSLLAASRSTQDVDCANRVAQSLLNQSLSPPSSPYILLANLYAETGHILEPCES